MLTKLFAGPAPLPPPDLPRICIVTPVLNGAAFLDATIASVVTQAGDFVLHYHIQDGGSTDGTLRIVERWRALVRSGRLPNQARHLVFTVASEPDAGLYDAVTKGFARALPPGGDVMMNWIGSDDLIAPGGLATICAVRRAMPEARLMGGRVGLIDGNGCLTDFFPIWAHARSALAAGLYDGRRMRFVMQEGTFWCADLWQQVGGLDTRFRMAGDWDLWRRMARHADHVAIEGMTALHRRHAGQLSDNLGVYYEEIDRMLDDPAHAAVESGDPGAPVLRHRYERTMAALDAAGFDYARFGRGEDQPIAVRYWPDRGRWERLYTE